MEFSHKLIDNVQYLVKSNACTVFLSKLSLAKRFVHDLLVPDSSWSGSQGFYAVLEYIFLSKLEEVKCFPHIRVGAFDQVQQLAHLDRAEACVASDLWSKTWEFCLNLWVGFCWGWSHTPTLKFPMPPSMSTSTLNVIVLEYTFDPRMSHRWMSRNHVLFWLRDNSPRSCTTHLNTNSSIAIMSIA